MQKRTEILENPITRTIKGKEWVVTLDKEGKRVIDVCVRLTKNEYEQAQRKLFDPNSTFQNTSSIGLLKNGFAKARSEAELELNDTQDSRSLVLTNFLNDFENKTTHHLEILNRSINGVFSNPVTKVHELIVQTTAYGKEIVEHKKDIEKWLKRSDLTEAQKVFVREDLNHLYSELLNNTMPFYNQLMALQSKKGGPSVKEVELLLSAQNRGNINSLGSFIGQQTHAIADTAIKITTTLKGRYLLDLYGKNEVTAAFIDAKAKLRLKNIALLGAEFNDTYSATKTNDPLPEEGLFSVMPYLEGNTAADLDKIICLISEESLSHRTLSTMPKTALGLITYASARAFKFVNLYVAPLSELVFTPLHLLAVGGLTVARLFDSERADAASERLLKFHEDISLVKWSKRVWNTQYKRLDDEGNLAKDTDPHQEILELYKNDESIAITLFELVSPQSISQGISYLGNRIYEFGSQTLRSFVNTISNPKELLKPAKTSENTFQEYVQNYHRMKPIMQYLHAQADKTTPRDGPLKPADKFPGITRQRYNKINSPARVFCDVMYIFDEHIINHLAETRPGPATLFFLISVGTFGSNLAPAGALAWMHGAPSYLQLIPTEMSKYFTGYTGPMGGPNGALAATLQFKLSTMATLLIGEAFNKNNAILEQMASNPEEIMAAFVAFVGIGYAVGYMPHIPLMPSNIPGLNLLNGYGEVINGVVHEAAVARNGVMPFTAIEYGFLGFKTLLVLDSMTSSGKSKAHLTDLQWMIQEFKQKEILDPNKSAETRENEIRNILKHCKSAEFKDPKNIKEIISVVNQTIEQMPLVRQNIEHMTQQITEEREAISALINDDVDENSFTNPNNSFEKLQQAIKIFSDPDTPITFPADKRREAIQCYNHLNALFDAYNQDVKKGKYAGHQLIPKEDYLQAFRNRHCSTGSNNFVRLLSFYPGYPIRFLWRTAQVAFNPTPYVKDKIQASKEKDVVLRHQWTAIFKNAGYTFINLINKSTKAIVGFIPAIGIIGQEIIKNIRRAASGKETIDFEHMSLRLQILGRWLDKNISIQNELPTTELRSRVGEAAHATSNYNDLQEAGVKVNHRLQENIKIKDSPETTSITENLSQQREIENDVDMHHDDRYEWEEDFFVEAPYIVHSQQPKQQTALYSNGTETTHRYKTELQKKLPSDAPTTTAEVIQDDSRKNSMP